MIYEDIGNFYNAYRGKKCIIGRSVLGRDIFAVHIGDQSGRQLIAAYAVHGREWITARLALRHIREGLGAGWGGWIIPLVNPDGAAISQSESPLWKANGRGVDINCNFDAEWGTGRLNTSVPGSENCVGDYPFSEPESRALRDFTLSVRPAATVSYHTKGREIYWEFGQRGQALRRDEALARALAERTGYRARVITGSAGGYKDWCIRALGIPAFTIEAGSDALRHPLGEHSLPSLLEENGGVPALLCELLAQET